MIQGKQKTEKEYRALDVDSSSSLKEFSLDRRKYYKKYVSNEKVEPEEDSKASVIGRVTETLLLEKDEFDSRFYMSSITKTPSGLMGDFVEALYKYTILATNEEGNIIRDFNEIAQDAYRESGFKIKFEAVLGKFIGSDAEIFYKEIREVRSKGLTVITTEDVTNSERIVEELKTNPITAEIVNLVSSDRFLVQNQLQIENYEVDGMKFKSMMDKVIIDHKLKTIQCYDLKCVWNVEDFYENYYLFRRSYIQAYLYKQACYELKNQLDLQYYTVLNPIFIVVDSINYYSPLLYTLNSDDMDDAYNGFDYKGKKYPGVKTLISELKWAKENNQWRITKKNYENNGILNIKG